MNFLLLIKLGCLLSKNVKEVVVLIFLAYMVFNQQKQIEKLTNKIDTLGIALNKKSKNGGNGSRPNSYSARDTMETMQDAYREQQG